MDEGQSRTFKGIGWGRGSGGDVGSRDPEGGWVGVEAETQGWGVELGKGKQELGRRDGKGGKRSPGKEEQTL